ARHAAPAGQAVGTRLDATDEYARSRGGCQARLFAGMRSSSARMSLNTVHARMWRLRTHQSDLCRYSAMERYDAPRATATTIWRSTSGICASAHATHA